MFDGQEKNIYILRGEDNEVGKRSFHLNKGEDPYISYVKAKTWKY